MKPAMMTLAVASALFFSSPTWVLARPAGRAFAGRGFAGRAIAHGMISNHRFFERAAGPRGLRERFAGRSFAERGESRFQSWRGGRSMVGGSFSGWVQASSAAPCSGPAIYEIGPRPRRRRSRLPMVIYGSAPPCMGQPSYGGGPGIYSLD